MTSEAGTPQGAEHTETPVGVGEGAVEGRRYPSTIGGLCYLTILGVAIAGVVVAALGSWRLGVYLIAAALVVAGGLRAALPQRDAGMLAVRGKALDSCLLIGVGLILALLASGLPDGP
ncbi:DUF3017 domain-containing protein [Nocardioides sp.]|uniref:DUF3017 domain-containing protein n=1 Tax=Nocardioides sp. TaxID=35761 RepID=UPI00262E0462|nr:DUF3017 domain-containing protein [Nocardioides sp.]